MSIAVEVKPQQLQPVLKEQDSDLHENCSQENKRPTALNSALLFTVNNFHIESWHPLHLTIKENKSVSSRTELLKIGLRNSALNWWVCFLNHASAWNKRSYILFTSKWLKEIQSPKAMLFTYYVWQETDLDTFHAVSDEADNTKTWESTLHCALKHVGRAELLLARDKLQH